MSYSWNHWVMDAQRLIRQSKRRIDQEDTAKRKLDAKRKRQRAKTKFK